MRRLLVTGGAGFIGSHYVRTLLDDGYPGVRDAHVTVLDALTYAGSRANVPAEHPRLTFVQGSVCDAELVRRLLPGHDAVVHFAAETHVDRSIVSASEFVRTNVEGTQVLLDGCLRAGVRRVVHVSTDEVYGTIDEGVWTEESPLLPNSPYAASKASSDLVALAYRRTHGLAVSITRSSNTYGPYQHPEKFIPKAVTNLLTGEPIPLYGDGRQLREWLHVADHCRAIHLVLVNGAPGEVYNIGGHAGYSNLAIAERLIKLCGADPGMITHVTDRLGHDRRYALDHSKIRRELGWQPRIALAGGLADTAAWYRDHPLWWRAAKEHEGPR